MGLPNLVGISLEQITPARPSVGWSGRGDLRCSWHTYLRPRTVRFIRRAVAHARITPGQKMVKHRVGRQRNRSPDHASQLTAACSSQLRTLS
jgi:hypothetical protein